MQVHTGTCNAVWARLCVSACVCVCLCVCLCVCVFVFVCVCVDCCGDVAVLVCVVVVEGRVVVGLAVAEVGGRPVYAAGTMTRRSARAAVGSAA